MEKNRIHIKKDVDSTQDIDIPVFLSSTMDEMGVMVSFDGDISQVEQICNFSYTQTGNTVTLINTVDISKISEIFEVVFDVDWGDGTTDTIGVHNGTLLNTLNKVYSVSGEYTVAIKINTPWMTKKIKKVIQVPQNTTISNPLGTFSGFTIPYETTTQTQDYLNDLDYTNTTGNTTFNFAATGVSRISEKKLYGSTTYSGVTVGSQDGVTFSGYTIDDLYYMDFEGGITMITGSTSNYDKEELFNQMLTRNEHFIGFIDEPSIYSDIFVERGKQGVLEKTFRLSEINNMGELEKYGNGYFNIRKQ